MALTQRLIGEFEHRGERVRIYRGSGPAVLAIREGAAQLRWAAQDDMGFGPRRLMICLDAFLDMKAAG